MGACRNSRRKLYLEKYSVNKRLPERFLHTRPARQMQPNLKRSEQCLA